MKLPEQLTLRLVRCRLDIPGFRARQVTLVTTLLDSAQYPPSALSQLYLRRWAMELTLRHLKTTLQMEHLISFAGSLTAARRYAEGLLQVRSAKGMARLIEELFRVIALDLLPQ